MSDTPRTDAALCISFHPNDLLGWPKGRKATFNDEHIVPAGFARQLERELTDSLAREVQLREAAEFAIVLLTACGYKSGCVTWDKLSAAISLTPPPVVTIPEPTTQYQIAKQLAAQKYNAP